MGYSLKKGNLFLIWVLTGADLTRQPDVKFRPDHGIDIIID